MTFPSGLRALNHRNFRRFFIGQAVSLVGTWMQSVAQSWLVLQLTDSAFKLGLIGTLQFAPVLAFAVLAGALADRLPKRRLILGTQTLLATQALALAALVWSGHVRFWHVGLLALVLGFANALDMPARQSFVADLVVKADVVSAVALNSAAFNAARIVGPAVAGLLIARVGVAPAFLLNGLSFLVVIGALLATNVEGRSRRAAPTTIFEEIREGLAYARHTPRIRFILSVLLVVSLCVFNFSVLVPLLARNVLHQGAAGFGFLMAAIGVGAVAGALTLGMLGRRPRLRVIVGAGALACAAFLGVAFVRDFGVALAVLFVVGFAAIITAAGCNTTLQVSAPDALRGRVMSLYILIFSGSFPVGAFLMGAISERWGVSTAFFVGGATGLLGLAVITISSRSRR
jgi:predicted MFS family arabinose efflux permease